MFREHLSRSLRASHLVLQVTSNEAIRTPAYDVTPFLNDLEGGAWHHTLTPHFPLTPHLDATFGVHGSCFQMSPYWFHLYLAANFVSRILYIELFLASVIPTNSKRLRFSAGIGENPCCFKLCLLPFWRRSWRTSTLHWMKKMWILFGDWVWIISSCNGFLNCERICADRIQRTLGCMTLMKKTLRKEEDVTPER